MPLTSDQRLKALVEHTAGLDKARVLQRPCRIGWRLRVGMGCKHWKKRCGSL
ncbi:hypothetical protein IMW75_06430 [Pseudomonas gregormendelii]|uniref:Uncharacterized protein n=1 Tax=Pseudomonas gregormendelii TaxID=1628277 RepID=A0ABS3AF92_9PSED|nr:MULTISPECIES: hypothetical protein [Pseudomonas]MBN3964929.1 hypothetical protein [Pseudomonas gregormendelii]